MSCTDAIDLVAPTAGASTVVATGMAPVRIFSPPGGPMTGPDHYRKARETAAKAHDYLGQGRDRTARPSGPPSPRSTPPSPLPQEAPRPPGTGHCPQSAPATAQPADWRRPAAPELPRVSLSLHLPPSHSDSV